MNSEKTEFVHSGIDDSTIMSLSRADKLNAVDVLALAFYDYPVMRYVLKDAGNEYKYYLHELIGFFVESRLTREWPLLGIKKDGALVAVAAANNPGVKPRPKALQEVYICLTETIGPDATKRLETFERTSSLLVPRQSFYYLGMIGVRPKWQKRRLAGKLLQYIHTMSEGDHHSTGVCLSTEDPTNVPIYEHFGYKIVGEADLEELHTWVMFRENGSVKK